MNNALELFRNKRWMNPFDESSLFQMDRLFNEMLTKREEGKVTFSPSCEVTENDKTYLMKFDIPGVKKENIKVEMDGDQLTVRAERREEKKEDTKKRHYSEVYYGTYTRSFTLPKPVDEKAVVATYENGILSVTIPKMESLPVSKAKQITVT